jgi:hypothetical protein
MAREEKKKERKKRKQEKRNVSTPSIETRGEKI